MVSRSPPESASAPALLNGFPRHAELYLAAEDVRRVPVRPSRGSASTPRRCGTWKAFVKELAAVQATIFMLWIAMGCGARSCTNETKQ